MSTDPTGGHPDDETVLEGEVIQFPGTPAPAAPPPRPAAAPGRPGELRDIIPGHLKTIAGIRKAIGWRWHRACHITAWHLVRVPKRAVLTVVWAAVGIARIAVALLAWWWVSEETYLRHEAVAANDPRTWLTLHKHAREARLTRGMVLLAGAAVIAIVAAGVTVYAGWAWALIGAAAVPVAGLDRPPGQ